MLQHQIVQSPARLGLTNPNSPSILNPNPPKLPPSQTHHHQDRQFATPSAALLSLLPPLPRAQALLFQMASLASKLFEVSPNRSVWVTAFRGSLPTFLSSQSQAHSSSSLESSPSTTKEIISLFTALQTQIFEAVSELQEIIDLQDAKQKIDREIRSKDLALLAFANKLKAAERELDILVDDYSDYHRSTKRFKSGDGSEDDSLTTSTVSSQLKLSDILSYAHRISYTTFAPPEFGAGTAPLRGALPPAPQEEQMRASQLYNFADLDIGLPRAVETKEKTVEAIIEPPPIQPVDTNPLSNLSAIQGLLPPNFSVPPGWKPGMPVQLPIDIPIKPPPGWKPGDPVALPPMDSLSVSRFEEPKLPPHIPQPKQPEVIQVQHVNLDLGGSDSSDYSSDEASSDDED
ncbi:mediator of RNA polymerase II transcription subunit 4-like [Cicer arietinum]|uniref:Mediator of RNA polymerase II transcription subunit 4 n=1 Tax=Cicer arietinum TaxID=3827 RepID=A0A1S2YKX7_CICAR|nr:mediator of RNA polymerase II transcription subunit 4-like [Cicer arietinum]XP_004506337.1 mediator of RNA polymerase II transcription subunit 4-like [Cicer arietinum]XP_004506338.1 mediator of RNA polymerase II transcription subunit 4-like [Cicer arietinum]XP_027191739.1 mediator of RNA polymerase II transcription subunit 4-like [Cicer arietinum]